MDSLSAGYRFLLLAIVACILSGCDASNPDRARLVGDWGLAQPDSVMRRLDRDDSEPEDQEPKMMLRFQRNGNLQTETEMGRVDSLKQGSWEMVSFDAEANTMTIACELMSQQTEHLVLFIDQDTIELNPPNMAGLSTKLVFKRQ